MCLWQLSVIPINRKEYQLPNLLWQLVFYLLNSNVWKAGTDARFLLEGVNRKKEVLKHSPGSIWIFLPCSGSMFQRHWSTYAARLHTMTGKRLIVMQRCASFENSEGKQDSPSVGFFSVSFLSFPKPTERWGTDIGGRRGGGGGGGRGGRGGGKEGGRGRRGEGRLRREQSAGLLWITWSSVRLRIYSSTAAVRGSGASCMLLPRIIVKPGRGLLHRQDSGVLQLSGSTRSHPN